MSEPIDDPILARVRECWEAAADLSVEDAMATAESAVVRWAWLTDGSRCSPEPFYAQRQGWAPGRELRAEPDTTTDVARCGFDEHNRAVVSYPDYHAGYSQRIARFFEDGTCRQLVFDAAGELVSLTLYEHDRDVLVRQAELDRRSPSAWRYLLSEYSYANGGVLERVHRREWGGNWDAETLRQAAAGMIEEFEYDEKGRLARITARGVLPGPAPKVVYKRRTTSSSADKVQTRFARQLAEAIEDAVQRCAFEEEVWCLALHYERESPFPPDVVVGAERERSEWGTEVDLLNPAEWDASGPPRRLRLKDPGLLDACAEAWDALATRDEASDEAAKVLNLTAKRLNRGRLGDHLNVTEDFFVYAVGLELEDLDANLRAALDDALYRELVNSGLTSP